MCFQAWLLYDQGQAPPADLVRPIWVSLLVDFRTWNWRTQTKLYIFAKILRMSCFQEIHFYAIERHRGFVLHEAKYIKKYFQNYILKLRYRHKSILFGAHNLFSYYTCDLTSGTFINISLLSLLFDWLLAPLISQIPALCWGKKQWTKCNLVLLSCSQIPST